MLLPLALLLFADSALVGGTVHSMVPGEEPRVATILIHDQRITVVDADVEVPPGTALIDVTGKHLVPGLIDGMVNFDRDHDTLYLCAGITVVRDMGGPRIKNLLERNMAARERTPGPTLYTAGAPLDGDPPSTTEAAVVRNAISAEGQLSILMQDEPDFLHLLRTLPEDAYRRVLQLAPENDIEVWGPVPARMSVTQALEAGQRNFLYIDPLLPADAMWGDADPSVFDEAVAALGRASATMVPALHAAAGQLVDQNASKEGRELLQVLAPSYEQWWVAEAYDRSQYLTEEVVMAGRRGLDARRALFARLHAAGVRMVPGSGAPAPWLFPGQSFHQELDEWVQAGLSNDEVLAMATHGAAVGLGIDADHGTLAPGKYADVLVLSEDPRTNLRVLLAPETVVLRGRVLEKRDLDDMIDQLRVHQTEVRVRLAEPVRVGRPPTPEGAVVLSGQVETYALRQRTSAERFAVVRMADGGVAVTGRLVYPDPSGRVSQEMTVEQVLRDGQLEEFKVAVFQAGQVLTCEGIRFGESFRVQRKLAGKSIEGVEVARGRIRALDVGSVTSLIVMGQLEIRGDTTDFLVLALHEMLTPETANWSMQMDDKGDHQVKTHVGRMAFRFDERGAPLLQLTEVGRGVMECSLVEGDKLGGGGFPLPASKRRAAAPKPAEAGGDGEAGGTEEAGGAAGDGGE